MSHNLIQFFTYALTKKNLIVIVNYLDKFKVMLINQVSIVKKDNVN